ncbi:ABC transporter substrate-binding protein [Nocardia sp. NRRL S-836]|uniref:ABC transporter substrate-binding protein n=1 Tax=Nocardia sp. NRRL S-836 TaxID=1519492 RepID=UPI0006B00976|nr:ABC transporter substrate-binding protein [Nocardia sp. NRRL S-836]KOV87973.1 ABC transporter iron(III)/siderophore-binding protein [Nocardia sp. NRRL S-836]
MRRGIVLTSATALVLSLSACGSAGSAPNTAEETTAPAPATAAPTAYPLTIENCGRRLTFDKAPSRVLLLNGASVAEVESFVALGIQDRIAANSQSYGVSDDPSMVAKVKAVPTGGLTLNDNFEVPREQIVAQKPDFVISTWAGGFDDRTGSITRDQLTRAGITSYVTPSNCANGDSAASPADRRKYEEQSIESSHELLLQLGQIFDVQQRAADLVNQARAEIDTIRRSVAGKPKKNVLVVYPGMAMMNSNGLPAVFAGGIFDDIVVRAGGVNAFAGRTNAELAEINAEALASAEVDLLVVGLYQETENADVLARDLFTKFPQWAASKNRRYTSVSDSFYLGPLNALAVKKIADAAHGG